MRPHIHPRKYTHRQAHTHTNAQHDFTYYLYIYMRLFRIPDTRFNSKIFYSLCSHGEALCVALRWRSFHGGDKFCFAGGNSGGDGDGDSDDETSGSGTRVGLFFTVGQQQQKTEATKVFHCTRINRRRRDMVVSAFIALYNRACAFYLDLIRFFTSAPLHLHLFWLKN